MNTELLDYIKKARQEGVYDKEIKENLIKEEWRIEDIENALKIERISDIKKWNWYIWSAAAYFSITIIYYLVFKLGENLLSNTGINFKEIFNYLGVFWFWFSIVIFIVMAFRKSGTGALIFPGYFIFKFSLSGLLLSEFTTLSSSLFLFKYQEILSSFFATGMWMLILPEIIMLCEAIRFLSGRDPLILKIFKKSATFVLSHLMRVLAFSFIFLILCLIVLLVLPTIKNMYSIEDIKLSPQSNQQQSILISNSTIHNGWKVYTNFDYKFSFEYLCPSEGDCLSRSSYGSGYNISGIGYHTSLGQSDIQILTFSDEGVKEYGDRLNKYRNENDPVYLPFPYSLSKMREVLNLSVGQSCEMLSYDNKSVFYLNCSIVSLAGEKAVRLDVYGGEVRYYISRGGTLWLEIKGADNSYMKELLSNLSFAPGQPSATQVESQKTSQSEQVIQKENLEWNQYVHPNFGITIFYPADWKILFDYLKPDSLFFVTKDYELGKSGARINFIYGLTNNENWQSVVSAMYGGRSKNELIQLNGKSILKTTYEARPEVEALSLPVANGEAFVSLFLEPSSKTAVQYIQVLEEIIKKIQLPTTLSTQWQTYVDEQYGYTFIYPPQTNLQNTGKAISISVRYGYFHGDIRISNKLQSESLMEWLNRTTSLGPDQSYLEKPTSKIINGYNAIEEVISSMVGGDKNIYLEKDNLVIIFSRGDIDFPGFNFPLTYQKILDSFRFK